MDWGSFAIGFVVGWLVTLAAYTLVLGLCQSAATQNPEKILEARNEGRK